MATKTADALSALVALSGEKKAKKRETCVEVDTTPVQASVDAWVSAKIQIEAATAIKAQAEETLTGFASERLVEACSRQGEVRQSVKLGPVQLTWKRGSQMFSRGSLNAEALRKALGDSAYLTLFNETPGTLQLTEAATSNQAFIADLVELVRKHQKDASLLVTSDAAVEPKDVLYDMRVLKADEYKGVREKLDGAGVKDQKPSFSLKDTKKDD